MEIDMGMQSLLLHIQAIKTNLFWLLTEDFFFLLSAFIFFAGTMRLSPSYWSKFKFYTNSCIVHVMCSFPVFLSMQNQISW